MDSQSYFIFDSIAILTLFGNSGPSSNENLQYSFYTSAFDFIILAILRAILYYTSHRLSTNEKSSLFHSLEIPFTSFCVASVSFSFLKCLVYSEQEKLAECMGAYLLPVWTILSTAYFYRLWSKEFESCFEKRKKTAQEEKEEKEAAESTMTMAEQIKILVGYSAKNLPWLLVGSIISLTSSSVSVALPHYTSLIMNGITTLKDGVDISNSIKMLAGLTIASMILSGLGSWTSSFISTTSQTRMRKDLFDAVMNQEIAFFDSQTSGKIVSRVTHEADFLSYRISDMFTGSVNRILTLGGKLLFMISISWQLTLMNFAALPIIAYVTKLNGDFNRRMFEKEEEASENSLTIAHEVISSMRTVRSFGGEKRCSKKFADAIDRENDRSSTQSFSSIAWSISYNLFNNIVYLAVLIYGARLVQAGKVEASALVAFMLYQQPVASGIMGLSYEYTRYLDFMIRSRKFCEFLVRRSKMSMAGTIDQEVKGEMKLDGVSFKYPNRPTKQVLNDLNLHIKAGETLALVGPSGAGKSTIVALLERFYDADEGTITMDGVPLEEFNHEYYHRKIALVAQEPVLFDCSVRDNIGFGCDATEEEIIEAAKIANAHDFVMELEKGYGTKCGERGAQMSGGQKQRIAIARALVRNPSVLILDEATSALDNQSEQIVQEAMERCAEHRTVIVIAHRLTTIQKADRIAVIDKGQVVQLGSHNELLQDTNGLYYTLARANTF